MRWRSIGAIVAAFVGSLVLGVGAQQYFPPPGQLPTGSIVNAGTGTATATLGGTLFTSATATATTGTIEQTLLSYTLPAGTLAVNGHGLRITVGFTEAVNANAKTRKLYFGATVIATRVDTTSGQNFMMTAFVFPTGATAQYAEGWDPVGLLGTSTTPAETLSGTILIKVTGTTPTAAGDLTNTFLLIEAI